MYLGLGLTLGRNQRGGSSLPDGAVLARPGRGSITVAGFAPTVSAGVNITPGVGSVSVAGFAPDVTIGGGVNVTTGVGTITLAGFAPTVSAGVNVTPGFGAVTVAGFAPTVTITPEGPTLSTTIDGEMEINGSGDISLTVTSPAAYAGGPYTVDQSTATTGNLNTTSIETGPQCAVKPAISRTSGASDTVGSTYTRVTGLWLYDSDDAGVVAGEWYLSGVATGVTAATYSPGTAGDVDWRDSVTGAGATRGAISNEITVAASGSWAITGSDNTLTVTDQPTAPATPTISGGELTLTVTG